MLVRIGGNASSRRKEGAVGECELPQGRKLIRDQGLANALVCADALHGQQETARAICEDIRTRRRNENVTGALMLARTTAPYFFARSGMSNCQAFKEEMQANPSKVFDLVMRKQP